MPLGLEAVCLFLLCQQQPSKTQRNVASFVGSDSCRAELNGTGSEFGLALDRTQNAYAEVRKVNGTPTLLVIQYANDNDKCGTVRDIIVAPNPAYVFEFECIDLVNNNRVVIGVRAEKPADARQWKALGAWVVDFEKLKLIPTSDPVTCINFDYSGQDDGSDVKTRSASRAKGRARADSPESIAKAMFPNAPDNRQDINCFRSLTVKMSVNDVVQKCGRPDEELGSGLYIFVWRMPDGSSVSIGTPYLERIGPVRLTDASGKTTILPRKK